MTKEQELYLTIGRQFKDAIESQLFGKPCFKINGKAFMCFFQNELVFKLTGEVHAEALYLEGSHLFDPSDKNRPMKEWVQVSTIHFEKYTKFANEAMKYVSGK